MKISFAKFFSFLVLSILFPLITSAGTEHNLSGWAWSDNIGWISFNSTNCDTDGNGKIDTGCGGDNASENVVDYGVNKDENNNLIGYAWANPRDGVASTNNIGWIRFGGLPVIGVGVNGMPSGAGTVRQNARMGVDGNLTGWVRALSAIGTDGWDGWISLSGTGYGVKLGSSAGSFTVSSKKNEFENKIASVLNSLSNTAHAAEDTSEGFAWGSDVVGWVDFSGVALAPATPLSVLLEADPRVIELPSETAKASAELTWTVTGEADKCEASGDWSGDDKAVTGGSQNMTGLSAGVYTYTLTCSKGTASAQWSASVQVLPPGGGDGGDNGNGGSTPPGGGPESCVPPEVWTGTKCGPEGSVCEEGYNGTPPNCTRRVPRFQNN